MKKRWIAMLLAAAMVLALAGCGSADRPGTDLMEGVRAHKVTVEPDMDQDSAAAADFGVRLLQSCAHQGENTLVSPLSVLSALAMTANGAEGETLAQMEAVLGLPAEELNCFFYRYRKLLEDKDYTIIRQANASWFNEDPSLTVEEAFLQTNGDCYGAELRRAPFDGSTLTDINAWVSKATRGMIPEVLDDIPPEAVMYLVNALSFDGDWENPYKAYQVHEGTFTTEDGREQQATLMFASESCYLEDELATGFLKYYAGREYAFAALLPKEGVTVEDYVNSLTGEHLYTLLLSPEETLVETVLPKFETTWALELSEPLKAMGMTDAFDAGAADFSRLGSSEKGNIFLSRVLHKTVISVTETGTRAGAVAVVEAEPGAAPNPKIVRLDRPFVYLLIDCKTGIPLFIGTMMDLNN